MSEQTTNEITHVKICLRQGDNNYCNQFNNSTRLLEGEPLFNTTTNVLKIGKKKSLNSDELMTYDELPSYYLGSTIESIKFDANENKIKIKKSTGNQNDYEWLETDPIDLGTGIESLSFENGILTITPTKGEVFTAEINDFGNADINTTGGLKSQKLENGQYPYAHYTSGHSEGKGEGSKSILSCIIANEADVNFISITTSQLPSIEKVQGFILYKHEANLGFAAHSYNFYPNPDIENGTNLKSVKTGNQYKISNLAKDNFIRLLTSSGTSNPFELGLEEDTLIMGHMAIAIATHNEGHNTSALNNYAHAEGYRTTAGGFGSHSEGYNTLTSGQGTHAEGVYTYATNNYSHAEGSNTQALHRASHAEGLGTKTSSENQHVSGQYNNDNDNALFIIGNGIKDNNTGIVNRSNALEILKDGTIISNSLSNAITKTTNNQFITTSSLTQSQRTSNFILSYINNWHENITSPNLPNYNDKNFIIFTQNNDSKNLITNNPKDYIFNAMINYKQGDRYGFIGNSPGYMVYLPFIEIDNNSSYTFSVTPSKSNNKYFRISYYNAQKEILNVSNAITITSSSSGERRSFSIDKYNNTKYIRFSLPYQSDLNLENGNFQLEKSSSDTEYEISEVKNYIVQYDDPIDDLTQTRHNLIGATYNATTGILKYSDNTEIQLNNLFINLQQGENKLYSSDGSVNITYKLDPQLIYENFESRIAALEAQLSQS